MKNASEKYRLAALLRSVRAPLFILPVLAVLPVLLTAQPVPAAGESGGWKTRAELSYVKTSGNTDTDTIAGKLKTRKEGPVNRYSTKGSYLRTRDEDEETSNKLKAEARYERVLSKRLFALFTAGYERDKFSGYEYRLYAGPGLGAEFVKTERHLLKGAASIYYNKDEFSTAGDGSDEYGKLKAEAEYEWNVRENLKFSEALDYSVSTDDTDKYFIDSVTSVEVKVNGNVSLGVSYTANYQNLPPSPDIRHTDTTFLTNLIVDF